MHVDDSSMIMWYVNLNALFIFVQTMHDHYLFDIIIIIYILNVLTNFTY
jgi:hypothetical protein